MWRDEHFEKCPQDKYEWSSEEGFNRDPAGYIESPASATKYKGDSEDTAQGRADAALANFLAKEAFANDGGEG